VSDETQGAGFEGGTEGEALVVDMGGVDEEGTFEVLPRAIYPASVSNLTFDYSQNAGNPMWTWELEIDGGEYAGRKFYYHTTFTEGGVPRVKRALIAIGEVELANSKFTPEEVANEGRLIGKNCQIRLDTRPYEGKMRNNVRAILPPGRGDDAGFETGA